MFYGPGGLPVEQIGAGATYWFHHDQIGSTRLITDSTGTSQATYTYYPYGGLASTTGAITNPFRFVGQYSDGESGFYYLRARYYDPTTGQFVSLDPLTSATRQPYQYVADSPLNGVDPTGLDFWGWAQDRLVDIGRALPSPARQAYVGWLSDTADWLDYEVSGLESADTHEFADAVCEVDLTPYLCGAAQLNAVTEDALIACPLGFVSKYYKSQKAAREAARNYKGGGGPPIREDDDQGPHYHAVDKHGQRVKKGGVHFRWPKGK